MPVLGSSGGAQTDTLTSITATPAFDWSSARFSNWGKVANAFRFWGFNADGDYVDVARVGGVSYYNSGGTLQWTVSQTDIDATANNIAAVCKHGSYIYVVATVNASTNAWIAMIDSSGTVSNKTAITTTTTSNTFKTFAYPWLGVPNGATSLYLVGQGFGATSFNLSTLATVQTTPVATDGNYLLSGFLTSNLQSIGFDSRLNGTYGVYTAFSVSGPYCDVYTYSTEYLDRSKFGNVFLGLQLNNYSKYLYWDGYVIPTSNGSGNPYIADRVAYSISDFDDFAVNFLKEIHLYRDNTGDWS